MCTCLPTPTLPCSGDLEKELETFVKLAFQTLRDTAVKP